MAPQRHRVNLKRWFRVHTWSAILSLAFLMVLAITGILIYPLDQFGLRDISLRSPWLPARYEVNTWRALLRSLAVTPEGAIYAAHRHGIFLSRDDGQSWQDLTESLPGEVDPYPELRPPVLAMHPYDARMILASKGRGLALSTDGGTSWEAFGDSDDEDLSRSGIQDMTFASPGTVVVVADNGLLYRRFLDPDADEGWELTSLSFPYGEQRGVGVLDWGSVALYAHNGQIFSERYWWVLNHSFSVILLLLAITGVVLWSRRRKARTTYPKPQRLVPSSFFRMLHRSGGLVSWPLFFLLPLTGILLVHALDFAILTDHGVPTRWFPAQFDHNRWQGPVQLHLRTLVVSRNNMARMWAGHTYGLFASEDGGQHWTNVGASMQSTVAKQVDHVVVGPWWLDFLYVGNAQGLHMSRNQGQQWDVLLAQPVDALAANRVALYIAVGHELLWQKFATLITQTSPSWQRTVLAPPFGAGRSMRQTTLYQLLHDLHSGKLLGAWFTYILDIVAGLMLVQSVTGLFLWGFPRWQRWRRSRLTAPGKRTYVSRNHA